MLIAVLKNKFTVLFIIMSNFIHQRVIEKTTYNKHQNKTDTQDYQAYAAHKINSK